MTGEEQPKPSTREEVLARLRDKEHLAGIDLSGVDLSEMKLTGMVLTGANFSRTNLRQAILAGIDVREARFFGRKFRWGAACRSEYGPGQSARSQPESRQAEWR
ncbi:MAG: pentapeptide repeat-containing protein [Chloroflexi bacterium]|nr:pentapeptide repeat-containing protein [Chloroflexota bacterium]